MSHFRFRLPGCGTNKPSSNGNLVKEVVPKQAPVTETENGELRLNYPYVEDAKLVHIDYNDDSSGTQKTIRKTFLLNHGLLRLDSVKEAFQLAFVELHYGETVIALTADRYGFIPLTFKDSAEWTISGRKS